MKHPKNAKSMPPFLVVLGITQDGGYPQAGCTKRCCARAWTKKGRKRHVACVGIVDPETSERWIIDATPDFREQLRMLDKVHPVAPSPGISGILLTHGHIGHYTGLMQLGREVLGAKGIPVYAMPRMARFLSENGPWDQLVRLENISLCHLKHAETVKLNTRLTATPFLIPHRDEYTETVGYRITGPNRTIAYIPDTDRWENWAGPIEEIIAEVDAAFLDGTFYSDGEVPGRNTAAIPHPFIKDSMKRFAALSQHHKSKIRFIHLNHTNPALLPKSQARKRVLKSGFRVAEELERIPL